MMKLRGNMVKQSIDNLPTGICFFNDEGILVLCNKKMYSIFYTVTGHDVQSIYEFRKMLEEYCDENNILTLRDNTVWSIDEKKLVDNDGTVFTQFAVSNVTELYSAVRSLEERKVKMSELANHLEQLNRNIIAIMREEEILSMKMRVHNETGSTLLRIHRYFEKDFDRSEKASLVENIVSTTGMLLGTINTDDSTDALDELREIALTMGVTIEINGAVPDEPTRKNILISAIRECLTNAIRYAGASILTVNSDSGYFTIRNNGKAPSSEIIESGGLASLRKKTVRSGFLMSITSLPEFELRIDFGD